MHFSYLNYITFLICFFVLGSDIDSRSRFFDNLVQYKEETVFGNKNMGIKEEELVRRISEIRELAKEDKNIDAAGLIGGMLTQAHEDNLPVRQKASAFIWSFVFPPIALYYFVKFIPRVENDARRTAWICLLFGAIGLLVLWWSTAIMFSSPELKSIENLSPQDIQSLTQ
jgi:hypothetical protein